MAPFVLATLPACISTRPTSGATSAQGGWARTTRWCSWSPTTSSRRGRAAKAKWGGLGRPHVDALTRVDRIDGYAVALTPGEDGDATDTIGYNE